MTIPDFDALKAKGNEHLKNKEIDQAIACYTQAAEAAPESFVIWSNRSAAHQLNGDIPAAIEDADRCIALARNWPKGYHRKAFALQSTGDFATAKAVLVDGITACAGSDEVAGLETSLAEIERVLLTSLIEGEWKGEVSEEMGGYSQKMTFEKNGKMKVELMGRTQTANFQLFTKQKPALLEIDLSQNGMTSIVPYILEISNDCLHLCCPFLTQQIPSAFSGPGYVCMKRPTPGAGEDDLEIPTDSTEAMILFLGKCLEIVHSGKFREKIATDDEEQATNRKILKIIGVQSKLTALQEKFPGPLYERFITLLSGAEVDDDAEISRLINLVRQGMLECELTSSAQLASAKTAINAQDAERKKIQSKLDADRLVTSDEAHDQVDDLVTSGDKVEAGNRGKLMIVSAIAAAAAIGVYAYLRMRRN